MKYIYMQCSRAGGKNEANRIAKALCPTDPKAPEHRKCADAIAYGIRIGLKAAKIVGISAANKYEFGRDIDRILAGDQGLPEPEGEG